MSHLKAFFKDSTEFLYISIVFIYRHLCAKQVVPVGVDNTKAFNPTAEQTLQILGPDGPMQLPNTKPALINVCWWLYLAYKDQDAFRSIPETPKDY